MPNTIYERLNLNFDTTKFGNVNVLGQSTLDYFSLTLQPLKEWQYSDIVNANAGKDQYFRNPLAGICDDLKISLDQLSSVSNGVIFENNELTGNLISSTASSASIEILEFKSHTDNISGVSAESMSPNVPNYDMVMSFGNEILKYVVNENPEGANASAFLGSLTSLFIEDDLEEDYISISTDVDLVSNSIRIEIVEDPEDPNSTIEIAVSNLLSNQVTSVYSNVSSLNSLVSTRRTEDWSYFTRMKETVTDIYTVKRFDSIGNTQIQLFNQYIGTDKLKNILANT
jgi:hypothetical protein